MTAAMTAGAEPTPLAAMSASEVSALLAASRGMSESPVIPSHSAKSRKAVVDARDLMTKVYGLIDDDASRGDCRALDARDDDGNMWLDSTDGYSLTYCDMTPEVSAVARFDDSDRVSEYCYFFLFPYDATNKHQTVTSQAGFTGTLLGEISDRCPGMGANPMTSDLFDATGEYEGNFINVRLIDDPTAKASAADALAGADLNMEGQYILMLIVEPHGAE